MPAAKIRDPVLSDSASNHLFCKILDHLACRGDVTFGKAINLLNKETLLFICEVLVDFGLEVSPGASLAFPAAHDGCMDEFVFFSNLAIICNSSLVDCGQRGLHTFFVDHFVVV